MYGVRSVVADEPRRAVGRDAEDVEVVVDSAAEGGGEVA